jgi:DNA processing protein
VDGKNAMKLFVLGKVKEADAKAVAVVGSRQMTARGERLTRDFVKALVRHGFTIVSGLARGVDTVAHRTALAAGGRTIAVLGSGIDVIYPPENKLLAQEIAAQGAVVSGFPKGTRPWAENFKARNKIIAGLSRGVLVVEGKRRSGTLSTAAHAANLGIEVFAVPGSEATDWLIGEGATPVQTPADIIKYLQLR